MLKTQHEIAKKKKKKKKKVPEDDKFNAKMTLRSHKSPCREKCEIINNNNNK